jgi:LmbE family N-acetylglucosaminyl deacetylase
VTPTPPSYPPAPSGAGRGEESTKPAGRGWPVSVLVVAPHADDETMGCAGTIARVKQLGGEVYCRVASLGGVRQYSRELSDATAATADMRYVSRAERRAEFDAAMQLLSVDGWDVLFDDTVHLALDTVPTMEIVGALERKGDLSLDAVKPTLVLIPMRTFNQDHDAMFRACLAATRPRFPVTRRHVPEAVLGYDKRHRLLVRSLGSVQP